MDMDKGRRVRVRSDGLHKMTLLGVRLAFWGMVLRMRKGGFE
jgi:hypothetical protein